MLPNSMAAMTLPSTSLDPSPSTRHRRTGISRGCALLAVATLCVACQNQTAHSPQEALGTLPDPAATPVIAQRPSDSPLSALYGQENTAIQNAQARAAQPAATSLEAPRLDVTSPDAMTQSLRRMDPTLSAVDRQFLRTTLMLYTMRLQQKITAIAQAYPENHPPQFSDLQLLQMAYGELNGKTGVEILALGRKTAQGLPPETLQAMDALQHQPANADRAPNHPSGL